MVGRDGRASGDELAYALIDGAVHAGAKVIDVGVISSPQLFWGVRALNAPGGVMVTASHNPEQYNGFKVVANRGEILEIIGGDHLRQIYDSREERHRSSGSIERRDIIADYTAAIAYAAQWHGGSELRLSVDAPAAVRRVLERLGPIAPDESFGARFDVDGDRVEFYADGTLVPADFIFLLLTEQLGLHPIVFDSRFSRTVRTRLDIANVPYFISRAGHLFMVLAMRHTGSVFGGEISGHYYWKEFNGMEAPELTLLRVYGLVQKSRRTLAELVAPYLALYKDDDTKIPVHDKKHAAAMLQVLAERFGDGKQKHDDGLTVEYPGWWFNIRQSNTEPLMRLTVEADTKTLLEQKTAEILALTAPSSV